MSTRRIDLFFSLVVLAMLAWFAFEDGGLLDRHRAIKKYHADRAKVESEMRQRREEWDKQRANLKCEPLVMPPKGEPGSLVFGQCGWKWVSMLKWGLK
jgi:hypothetical protein